MRELIHDHKLVRELLRNRLLRSALSAVATLDRAARNKYSFVNDEYKSAIVLARLAPKLLAGMEEEKPNQFLEVDAWYPERLPAFELLSRPSREENGAYWVQSFKVHGPTEHYKTMREAREYGRRRWDEREESKSREAPKRDELTLDQQLNESPLSPDDLNELEEE